MCNEELNTFHLLLELKDVHLFSNVTRMYWERKKKFCGGFDHADFAFPVCLVIFLMRLLKNVNVSLFRVMN